MSKGTIRTACVQMVGPDEEMDLDTRGDYSKPANRLPIKCPHCTFPELDYVANPYLLAKGFSSPAETSSALQGNFLVRERVKSILEIVVPNACTFHPTAEMKNKKPTPWWLAAPTQKLATIRCVHESSPCCSQCGEPRHAWGDKTEAMTQFDSGGVDVFKSLNWRSEAVDFESVFEETNQLRRASGIPLLRWSDLGIDPPPHPERWTRRVDRTLYFAVRLEQLFKRAKVKGQLVRYAEFKNVKPSPEDEAWIKEKFSLLAEQGLVEASKPAAGKSVSAAQKWFKQFLKKNSAKESRAVDFATVEKQQKLLLPQDYKDFISIVGEKSFPDVNELEGSTTSILSPQSLDFEGYRRGKLPDLEGEDAEVDGVMFAATDFGDCFVFDVSAKDNDYPVYWYRHEENALEQFAPNFAECIQRFVKKN